MSVEMTGIYQGNKKIQLRHEPSGTEITTAAPRDNNGDGSSFSPTDLFAVSLGACMMTTMAIFAERDGIDLTGMRMRLEKQMSAQPRRVAGVPVTIHMPTRLSPDERTKMERAALNCPVKISLHPDVDATVEFHYDV